MIVISIFEPFGPRIMFTASFSPRPLTDLPSSLMITSPLSMPAALAGVSSIGVITRTKPLLSTPTSSPTPPNSPVVCSRRSAKESLSR